MRSKLNVFGWRENPFNFVILPELLVGYRKEINKIVDSIEMGNKFSLIIGTTGSGKTTLMKYLYNKFYSQMRTKYIPKPPKNEEMLLKMFTTIFKTRFIDRLISREKHINMFNLCEWVNKKCNDRTLILIDEIHESNIEILEWIRTVADHTNTIFVFAGLKTFEDMVQGRLDTFLQRITTKIELTNLTKHEMIEMIRKRIEWVGGRDLFPFSQGVLDRIYEITNGFPRSVLRICDELVKTAIEMGITMVDSTMLEGKKNENRLNLDMIDMLPEKQRKIIEILGKYGKLSPKDIVEKIDMKCYKNKDNAVRSVNNILRRMLSDGIIKRERVGRLYRYSVSEKIKNLFIKG